MTARLEINMDNASFEPDALRELARTLDHLAQTIHMRIDDGRIDLESLRITRSPFPIFDTNGNKIGSLTVTR